MFGEGISQSGEIIDLGVAYDIIKKSGSWFSYEGTKLGQGRDAAKATIADNPELAAEIGAKIATALRGDSSAGQPAPKVADDAAPAARRRYGRRRVRRRSARRFLHRGRPLIPLAGAGGICLRGCAVKFYGTASQVTQPAVCQWASSQFVAMPDETSIGTLPW